MISNIRKNRMGTVSFNAKFTGMRKEQDFIVYPMHEEKKTITVQSETRIGKIDLETGIVIMSPPRAGGSYDPHLRLAKHICNLKAEQLLMLKSGVFATASGKAGTNGIIYSDNSGAIAVF